MAPLEVGDVLDGVSDLLTHGLIRHLYTALHHACGEPCERLLGGIRVDRLGERIDVMLKPLEGLLSGLPGITGTTIMGDVRLGRPLKELEPA